MLEWVMTVCCGMELTQEELEKINQKIQKMEISIPKNTQTENRYFDKLDESIKDELNISGINEKSPEQEINMHVMLIQQGAIIKDPQEAERNYYQKNKDKVCQNRKLSEDTKNSILIKKRTLKDKRNNE